MRSQCGRSLCRATISTGGRTFPASPNPSIANQPSTPEADPVSSAPISVERLRAMGEACVGTCADLHYPQLRTVIWGVLRTNVSGDEDGSIRGGE